MKFDAKWQNIETFSNPVFSTHSIFDLQLFNSEQPIFTDIYIIYIKATENDAAIYKPRLLITEHDVKFTEYIIATQ